MFDTSDAVPRSDGEMATRRATLTKYRLRTKGVKHPMLRRIQFSSREDLIEFIAGRYARKYLVGDPLLAEPGEPGFDPDVHREVQEAMKHYRPTEATKKKGLRQLKQKVLRPGRIRREGPEGSFMQRIVKMVNPFSKTRAGISAQERERVAEPKAPEPPPPEQLPRQTGRKTPVRGADYEGVSTSGFYDPKEAAKPSKIKYIYKHREHPHKRKSLTPEEVSVRSEQFRDPLASHEARVQAGLTPNLIQVREKPKKGFPTRFLEKGVADIERKQAQGLRDELAHRLRGQRKLLQLYRSKRREEMGLPALKPYSKTAWKKRWKESEKVPDVEIARGYKPEKPTIKPYIPVPGGTIHPGQLVQRHQEWEARVGEIAATHKARAKAISQNIDDRLTEAFERKHQQYGQTVRDTVRNLKKGVFHPNSTGIEDWQAEQLAGHLDTTEDWIRQQHRRYIHHRNLGEVYTGGEEKIRKALLPHLVKKLPSYQPEVKAAYPAMRAVGRKLKVGGGIAAAGLAALGGYKLLRRKKEHEFEAPGVQSALGNIQSKLKGWAQLHPNFSREAITAGSLVGGLSAADAAVSAIHPDPGKTRGQSALVGAQRGALYGGVLAGVEPLIRRPLMKRFLGNPNIEVSSKLKEIRFKAPPDEEPDTTKRDIAIGTIEAGAAFPVTERAVRWFHPKTGPGRALAAGAVGGLATGTIGYGLNRFVRAFKQKQRQKKTQEMAARIPKEILMAAPNMTFDSEGYNTPFMPGKRKVTVAQDRYRKLVRQHEIARQEGNIAGSAAAGAALSGLLRHKTGLGLKSSLTAGGAAGALTEAALIAHHQRTKDPFGEESIGSKRIERIPWQAAGLASAGILAKRHILSNRTPLIRFQQYISADQPKDPIYVREASRFLRHPASRTQAFLKWKGRAERIHRDLRAPKTKEGLVIDERGRPKTPEYKKPWVKRALYVGGATVGALGIAKGIGKLKSLARVGAGLEELKLPPSKAEQFAINVLTPGNVRTAIKSKVKRHFPGLTARAGQLKEKGGKLRTEYRSMRDRLLGGASASIEKETGHVQAGLERYRETGLPTGRIKVTNPAERKAHLEQIEREQEILAGRAAQLSHQKEQVKKISPAREAVEAIHKKKFEPDIPPTSMRSLLSEIRFQDGDWVQVKPHFRKPRREQTLREKKHFREAALGALAVGGTGIGVGGGTVYGIHRYLNREALHNKAMEDLEKKIASRAAEIRGTFHTVR